MGEKREELRKSLRVKSLENTFENLKPWAGTEEAVAAFKALVGGGTKWQMLLCYGGVGNGKTYFCEATAIELYKRGSFCSVLAMSTIMGALKSAINNDKHSRHGMGPWMPYDELLDRYCRCAYLIIDDVGMGGSGSIWEFGQLEEIIIARYRDNLFTIMTTNLDLTELPERVVSRFRDADVGRILLNSGADYRGNK